MKIKELKEILNKIPDSMDDVEITAYIPVGCCGEVQSLEDLDITVVEDSKYSSFRLDFSTRLEGHKSCIQRAETIRKDKEYWVKFPSSKWGKFYLKDVK